MRALTNGEKRTIRVAGIFVGIYLAVFVGFRAWRTLERQRVAYKQVVAQGEDYRRQIEPYQNKAATVKRIMEQFQLDPVKLSAETVVAEASAAIQKAAATGGIKLGTVHESPARPSSRELGAVQFEGTGTVPAIMTLLGRIGTLGYPIIVDSVTLSSESSRPGPVKMNLTIVILDFDRWTSEEAPHA